MTSSVAETEWFWSRVTEHWRRHKTYALSLCLGRFCERKIPVEGDGSRSESRRLTSGIIALIVVLISLAVLIVVLVALMLRMRAQRKYTGTYRPSKVEHKAGTLPLPTVAGTTTGSSTLTTPLHLVLGHTKHEILVWTTGCIQHTVFHKNAVFSVFHNSLKWWSIYTKIFTRCKP